jgi:hypothetical protein
MNYPQAGVGDFIVKLEAAARLMPWFVHCSSLSFATTSMK